MPTKISGNITKISDTEFTFTPTDNLDITTKYRMVIKSNFRSDNGLHLGKDVNSYFTTANNYLAITFPNINKLSAGTNINITWEYSGLQSDTIRVEFYDGTTWNIIGNGIPITNRLLNWNVSYSTGIDRQIKIISSSGYESVVTFEIYFEPLPFSMRIAKISLPNPAPIQGVTSMRIADAPTITKVGGVVIINGNGSIYYTITTDETEPTNPTDSSNLYTTPIGYSDTLWIKAICKTYAYSVISEKNYNIAIPIDYIASYKLDDNLATTNVIDETGNYNATSSVNTNTLSTNGVHNISNTSLEFNGTDQYISLPLSISANREVLSISLWIKTTESGTGYAYWNNPAIMGIEIPTQSVKDFGLTSSNGKLAMWSGTYSGGDRNLVTTNSINDNSWHLINVIKTMSNIKLYLDGVYLGSIESNMAFANDQWFMMASCYTPARFYHQGVIDLVRFYDRVLTSDEIEALYQEGL